MTPALIPCPFCGDAMQLWDQDTHARHVDSDGRCPLRNHAVQVDLWNTRAPVAAAPLGALKPMIDGVTELVDFLCGAGPLDGLWYGDSKGGPAFWWRLEMKRIEALVQVVASFPRVEPLAWREIDPNHRYVGTGLGFTCEVYRLHKGGWEATIPALGMSKGDFPEKAAALQACQDAYAQIVRSYLVLP